MDADVPDNQQHSPEAQTEAEQRLAPLAPDATAQPRSAHGSGPSLRAPDKKEKPETEPQVAGETGSESADRTDPKTSRKTATANKSRQKGESATTKTFVVPSLNPSEKWNSVYSLDDARTGVWQTPTLIIGNLLLAQSALLVSAHPHSMKSLAWLQAALEAPARKAVWGHFPAPNVNRTLFIETEDPPWLVQERIRGLVKGLGIKESEQVPGFNWVCPGPFDLVNDLSQIAKVFDRVKPDFAVISTLQNIIPGRDLNEQRDMAPVNKVVIALARKYCPIVMITHSTWDKQNRRALGTITQTANYATTLHFEKSGDQVKVTLDSKLGSEEKEFLLHLETAESSYVDKDGVEQEKQEVRRLIYKPRLSPKKAKVVAAIKDLGDSASAEEIAQKAGVSDRYVRKIKAKKKTGKKGSSERPSELASGEGKTVPRLVPPEIPLV
jgi:hypothetical protein